MKATPARAVRQVVEKGLETGESGLVRKELLNTHAVLHTCERAPLLRLRDAAPAFGRIVLTDEDSDVLIAPPARRSPEGIVVDDSPLVTLRTLLRYVAVNYTVRRMECAIVAARERRCLEA